jgi:RNA polymerase sigma-70 factor (ECF subfamily)
MSATTSSVTLLPALPSSEVRRRIPELLPDLRVRAMRLARDPAVADDILQDAVERALRFEHQYEAETNLRAWMSRILLSVFVSRCRRLRRERLAVERLAEDPCAWTLPEAGPSMRRLSPCAARALGAIPDAFRQAIELVDIADLSYRDAADTMGVPLGTVMSRLHRGRKLLAQAFAEPASQVPQAA